MNEAPTSNFATQPKEGKLVELMGTRQLFKATASQTGGAAVCAEITVPPGKGIPMHSHEHEDESFYVVSGEVIIEAENTGTARLAAGSFFYGPRGRRHSFRCEGREAATLLVFASPGANIGAMYDELSTLITEQGAEAVTPAQLGEIAARRGIHFDNA